MSINVTRSSMPPFEEYCDEIRGLWDSRWLTNMGCKHRQLEEDLQRYLQCGQITLFTNGHLALENILQAFRLEGEIITTPFTFASTTHAIVRCGCKPVFCDIDPVTYTLDPDKLEALITAKYLETVHIDDMAVLRIFSQTKQVEEYNLGEGTEAWSKRVIDVMETFERHG